MGFISSLFGYVLNILYNLVNNYGIAIIIFTVLLRIILIPVTIKQQKSMKKSAKMQEELKKIQVKYKNNPEKLNQETLELYKREKTNPFTGCFSAILQVIIILSVFWLVSQPLTHMKKVNKEVIENYTKQIVEENDGNKYTYPEIAIIEKKAAEDPEVYINMEFLGLDLSKVPNQSYNDWRVYVIPVLYVITSFISIIITTKQQKKMMNLGRETKQEGEKTQEEEQMESMQQMSNSMMYMAPIMSITISIIAPLGLALYWLVSNVVMIIERLIINKIFGKEEEEDIKRIEEAKQIKIENKMNDQTEGGNDNGK